MLGCNKQEETNAPLAGRRKSVGGRMADPNFIGYTYKNWDAVRPPNSALAGDCTHMCWFRYHSTCIVADVASVLCLSAL